MEEFSQSRGDDDLFDDEITPLTVSTNIDPLAKQAEQLSIQPKQPSAQQHNPRAPQQPTRARGRGRGRGRDFNPDHESKPRIGGLNDSKFAPKTTQAPQQQQKPDSLPTEHHPATTSTTTAPAAEPPDPSTEPNTSDSTTPQAPTEPASQAPARPPAVRGDRTATGGLKKPKLTEEELTAKIAAAKEKSQTLAAKHARAQADAESFAERERIAQVKRKEEAASRRLLEGEREKNRARKLQAMGGRDWDSEKNEKDFMAPRYGERIRTGPLDSEAQQDLSIYEWRDPADRDGQQGEYTNNNYRGRGREGGRGRGDYRGRGGRGRGRGRGGDYQNGGGREGRDAILDTNAGEQFPALPSATKAAKPEPQRQSSENVPGGSWADQMAA